MVEKSIRVIMSKQRFRQGSPTGGTRTPKGYEGPWVTEQLIYLL